MSKELEAFDRVWEDCSKLDLDYVSKHNLMDDLREIKKALTPPTADEVCEVLSEYYKMNTTYNNEDTPVFYRYVGIKKDVIAYYKRGLLTIPFGRDLPPHLITLIGRFYEAQQ